MALTIYASSSWSEPKEKKNQHVFGAWRREQCLPVVPKSFWATLKVAEGGTWYMHPHTWYEAEGSFNPSYLSLLVHLLLHQTALFKLL